MNSSRIHRSLLSLWGICPPGRRGGNRQLVRGVVSFVITTVALAAVVVHLVWPALAIDVIALVLVGIGILPWLGPILESIELPGGFKATLREVREVKDATLREVKETTQEAKETAQAALSQTEEVHQTAQATLAQTQAVHQTAQTTLAELQAVKETTQAVLGELQASIETAEAALSQTAKVIDEKLSR
jgi:hypothetical protein